MAKVQKGKPIPKQSSMQDSQWVQRKTIDTFKNKEGKIVELSPGNLGIAMVNDTTVLFPVNLAPNLRHAGIKIRFSGELKEIDATELWAGQPIFLTNAVKID